MPEISDAALPWVILFGFLGCVTAGAVGIVLADRAYRYWGARLAGKLSGMPVRVAPYGCDYCSVDSGEPHRYAGCPGNVRQVEREVAGRG